MKNVLNLKLIAMLAIAGAFLMACSDDDDDDDDNGTSITFDGTNYTIADGTIEDYGAYNPLDEASHYNYDFHFSDKAFIEYTEEGYTYWEADTTSTFYIYAELFSPGTSAFQTGTFEYMDSEGLTQSDIDGKFFFYDVYVGTRSGDTFMDYDATSGTVTVSGSGTNYKIEFDVTFTGGKKLTGTYEGSFKYSDSSEYMLKKK